MTETPQPYGNVAQTDFDSQFARVFQAAECRTQVELADVLGIKQSSISDAKRRKTVPAEWLIKLFEKMRINPEWLRTGLGNRFIEVPCMEGEKMPTCVREIEYRPAQSCTTDELVVELVRRALGNIR